MTGDRAPEPVMMMDLDSGLTLVAGRCYMCGQRILVNPFSSAPPRCSDHQACLGRRQAGRE